MAVGFHKCKAVGQGGLRDGVGGSRRQVQETYCPSCLDLDRDRGAAGCEEISGIAAFRSSAGLQILNDAVRTVCGEPDIVSVRVGDCHRELEQRVCGSVFTRYDLLELQPAAAVVPGCEVVRSVRRHDVFFAIDRVVVCTVGACCVVIQNEHGRRTVDDHRVVYFAGQLPTVASFKLHKFHDFVVVSGLDDIVTVVILCDLSQRNVDVISSPVGRRGHFNRVVSVEVIIPILGQDQFDARGRILLVKEVVPDFLNADRFGGQRHSLGNDVFFHFLVNVSGRIGERREQVRIRQQVIGAVRIFPDARGCQLRIRHGDEAVIQVRDGVIRFLTGPDFEFDCIGPAFLQRADLAEVPGNAVGLVVAGSGRPDVDHAVDRSGPSLFRAAGRSDVVFVAAGFSGGHVRADVGEGRDTVVHRDVGCAEVVDDRLRDIFESVLDVLNGVAVDDPCAVCVVDEIL